MAISRRNLVRSAVTLAAAAGLGGVAASAEARDLQSATPERVAGGPSVSQQDAHYQDQPKGDQRCAQCAHFVAPASCQVVIGTVVPNGWCQLFAAKSS